jgi:hypothetical protein
MTLGESVNDPLRFDFHPTRSVDSAREMDCLQRGVTLVRTDGGVEGTGIVSRLGDGCYEVSWHTWKGNVAEALRQQVEIHAGVPVRWLKSYEGNGHGDGIIEPGREATDG